MSLDTPLVFSALGAGHPLYPHLETHFLRWARNPDESSEFDLTTRDIRHLPDDELLTALLERGYDALIFRAGGIPCGHAAFQRHPGWLKMFSLYIAEQHRGRGFGFPAARCFIQFAHDEPGIEMANFGAGGHPAVVRLWRGVHEGRITFPFPVEVGATPGEIIFPDKRER